MWMLSLLNLYLPIIFQLVSYLCTLFYYLEQTLTLPFVIYRLDIFKTLYLVPKDTLTGLYMNLKLKMVKCCFLHDIPAFFALCAFFIS